MYWEVDEGSLLTSFTTDREYPNYLLVVKIQCHTRSRFALDEYTRCQINIFFDIILEQFGIETEQQIYLQHCKNKILS